MPKQSTKQKKQSINQIWLSIIFMIAILGNFFSVAGIVWYYENNGMVNEMLVFESDSNTNYMHFTTTDNYILYPHFNITTQMRGLITALPVNLPVKTELTPLYLGNNTWGTSIPVMNDPAGYYHLSGIIVMEIPNMDNFLITKIVINETMPSNDVYWDMTVLHLNTPVFGLDNFGSADPPNQETNIIPGSYVVTTSEMNIAYNLPLTKGLRIFENSQEKQYTGIEIAWEVIDPTVGLSAYAMQWKVQVFGEQISGWTLQDSLLASIIIWNIIIGTVIIYSLDIFDLGGFVKTIRKTRRT